MRHVCIALTLIAAMGDVNAQIAPKSKPQGKPNIVVVLMDNFGWGELGVYGGGALRGAPTPRIDKLASEGMRHTGRCVCV